MYKYESIVILKPLDNKDEINEVIEKFKNLMQEFSDRKVEVNKIGLRKLAYEIRENKEGYYAQYYFWGKPENIADLERNYRINDEVIKFMTLRCEEQELDNSDEEER